MSGDSGVKIEGFLDPRFNLEKVGGNFASRPNENEITLSLSGNNDILIMKLLGDGLGIRS